MNSKIEQDKSFIKWSRRLRTESTRKNYVSNFKVFCRFLNLTPTQLLDEAEQEQEANVLKSKRKIKERFEDFEYHLRDKELSSCTIHAYFNAVKSFYNYHEIDLPNLELEPAVVESEIFVPTKDDIRDILNVSDVLEKALVLVGCSSGLAVNEISNLRIKDLGIDNGTKITTIKLRRGKTKVDFITFLTPEATEAVQAYLEYRGRTSIDERKNKALMKQKVWSDNDYLFCVRNVPDTYLDSKDERERKFSTSGLMAIYRDLSEGTSKCAPKGEFNTIRSHNIRKFFNSTLLNAGCDFFTVELFMGHKLPATQQHYFQANPEELKKVYSKYVPQLTIQKELEVLETAEFQALLSENEILKEQLSTAMAQNEIKMSGLKKEIIKEIFQDDLKRVYYETKYNKGLR